ncbi:Ochratoxin a non-ribosomal peptide synthetase [Lasiodiplodia theobromae]|uniref:Ochratoxin a non-ribosomal peptide synthetase n=1 Tax=Lasiodiplodia theobromae TaxID=45133 RepID=UPI0015C383DF|nr:Ochratoxin a non-ribosomal peptide synthetase [Lasiodiplodia theobromae]KAF4542643.1 Ochratoxin a non-ribosomal peptide synthetase [Lasiodiplodia theobromae]
MGSITQSYSGGLSPFADRLITRRVDELAASQPFRTWVSVPQSNDISGQWREITFHELSQAVDGMARWIERTIGAGTARETVAYLGINDVRYTVVILAMIKANRKALLPSLRNSDDGQINLIQRTDCKHFLYSEGVEKNLKAFHDHPELSGHQIPSFDEMILEGAKGPYRNLKVEKRPYSQSEAVLVLHTSGSTGLPKPIYITNGWLNTLDHQRFMDAPRGRDNTLAMYMTANKSLFTMLPFFHTMGIITILKSIYCGPLIMPPPGRIPTAEMAMEILQLKKPWSGLFAPSVLEDMSETQKGLDALATMEYVFFAGAPLAKEAGDRITRVTKLTSMIGSTEACFIQSLVNRDPADWQYFEWSAYSGVVMEDAGEGEGLCECVIKPIAEPRYLGVFYTFPDIAEWRTKDLFEAHPTKPGLWRYKGRRDDVLVLNNGEKFNPVSFEKTVENHALVRGALVVGQSRFQPALLIEPDWEKVEVHGKQDLALLLDEVWPAVEKANHDAPAHAQVWKNKIAFTKRDKPFLRAAKGSIQRRATVGTYDSEIDALYLNEGQGFSEQLGAFDKDADIDATKTFLRTAFQLVLTNFKNNPQATDDADIFDLGADSLQAMALASALSSAIKSAASRDASVVPRDIYANPTVSKLAAALRSKLSATDDGQKLARETVMADMVRKYTETLPTTSSTADLPPMPARHTVVLTGSTGALGNFILQELIESPEVEHIYCLNRSDPATAASRQAQSFAERGETADFSKVTFLKTDFSQPLFALSQPDYDQMAAAATLFIHNAWAVDFNHALESYEPTHVSGVRRVVDFSLASTHRAHIAFISSVASVGNHPQLHPSAGPVPEAFFDDDRVPLPQGYGESKHVSGRILAVAASRAGVPASIVRCGQLGGPRGRLGVWNRHEWLPSLVRTSVNMGLVPAHLGNSDLVDWVPMDAAGRTVVEVSLAKARRHAAIVSGSEERLDVFHVQNPRAARWEHLVPVIREWYGRRGREVRAVEFDEWLDALRRVPLTDADEVAKKPGVKLIDFYEGLKMEGGALPPMETRHTQELSPCLRELKAVDGRLFENWMEQWGF